MSSRHEEATGYRGELELEELRLQELETEESPRVDRLSDPGLDPLERQLVGIIDRARCLEDELERAGDVAGRIRTHLEELEL